MNRWQQLLKVFVVFVFCASCVQVFASGGFAVRPISIDTSDGNGSLSISNSGAQRIYISAIVYKWTLDENGVDQLTLAPDAVVSPPAMWIEPLSDYTIRVRVPASPEGKEGTYRLLLSQVPTREDETSGGVVIAVTQSIPIFSQPAALSPAALSARIIGPEQLLISNEGGRRVRITDLGQDDQLMLEGLVGYALGESKLKVLTKSPIHPGNIQVMTDLGPLQIDVKE